MLIGKASNLFSFPFTMRLRKIGTHQLMETLETHNNFLTMAIYKLEISQLYHIYSVTSTTNFQRAFRLFFVLKAHYRVIEQGRPSSCHFPRKSGSTSARRREGRTSLSRKASRCWRKNGVGRAHPACLINTSASSVLALRFSPRAVR